MSKKINVSFLEAYVKLECACNEKFSVQSGGVSEYISRLYSTRLAPGRDEALPTLVRYRDLRNRLAHESGALENSSDLKMSDVKWVKRFAKDVERKNDPISAYLRRAKKRAAFRKAKIVALTVIVVALLLVIGTAVIASIL